MIREIKDNEVLEPYSVVILAFGNRLRFGLSLLISESLYKDVNDIF